MPGRKRKIRGAARIIQRGERGPSIEALSKILGRRARRWAGRAVAQFGEVTPEALEFTTKKRWRSDATIAASKAMGAIGIGTRTEPERKLRAAVHRNMQRYMDLLWDSTRHPDRRYDPEAHIACSGALIAAAKLIGEAKASASQGMPAERDFRGALASRKFIDAFARHMGTIEIVHGELGRRGRRGQ